MLRSFGGSLVKSALVFTLWLFGLGGAFATEVIHQFDSTVAVGKDGTLTVTETLRVRAEGSEIRHGIHRDFPLTFKDASGTLHEVTFDLLDVTRDGKPEPHFTQSQHGILRIYAGDKDVVTPRGDHTYVFHYRTGRQIRWFDGKPELDWNVTGNFWNFPIQAATYRLQLPDDARPLRWTAFTGWLGARGSDWHGTIGNGGVLTVATTQPLAAGEGLTVVAALPATSVVPPGPETQLWYAMLDNRQWVFGGVGFVLVFVFYVAAWSAVGRDPKAGTIIPLFHPPEGISAALANYIHNWGFSREKWRAFTAAALSLAVRGLMVFDQNGGKLTLTAKRRDAASSAALPPGESAIFTWVKGNGGSATIDRANGDAVAKVGEEFTASIEKESRNHFFRRNLGYVTAGVAMTVAVVIGVIKFGDLRDQDVTILFGLGGGGLLVGMVWLPMLKSLFSGTRFHRLVRGAVTLIFVAVFFTIIVNFIRAFFPNGFGAAVPLIWAFVASYPFSFVLVTAFAVLNGLFLYLMRAPTALGRPVMDQLAGFRLYLETAEADRLNMQAPEITAERFEALLPYAVALDVEKPWSDAFAAALRRANPGDPDPMQHYRPTWSSGGSSWSGSNFGAAVASTVGSVSSALASAAPASSGSSGFSSGGGGSGGGGGGGGGGGW
jgi:uncharacterized membrane protein YgcG